jgi:3-deoxy-manno-octulosonate cytidylyltransferase (CMP-KDO synthetase)
MANSAAVIAVIPARYQSTRFPGKMVAPLDGKPLVQHTYERALQAKRVDDVCVATDDARVADALAPYGTRVVMTRSDHPSGTDRIAEVAEQTQAQIVVNVQGDEPLIDPNTIDEVVVALDSDSEAVMSTAARALIDSEAIADPNVVKVVTDGEGRALYFSRAPIPYQRDSAHGAEAGVRHWHHIGLYAYRRDFLLQFAKMAPSPLEKIEMLEQLRALENGYAIRVVETQYKSIGVDTPEDLEQVRSMLEAALQD